MNNTKSAYQQLPEDSTSIWLDDSEKTDFSELDTSIDVDVTVVGGGIAGVTTAYFLQRSGMSVALVEKNTLASGTTGGTTGKVTTQHGLIYSKLLDKIGRKKAAIYASAYSSAINDIKKIIRIEKIDCDFTTDNNYVFTDSSNKLPLFKKEARVAESLGLPASFETKSPLPFPIKGAVKFSGQAKFNAAKYTRELAKRVAAKGGRIYENSNVTGLKDGDKCFIKTEKGSIAAKHIIVATKIPPFPLVARFAYAAYEYPETSYLVAGRNNKNLKGMYISPDNKHYSILPFKLSGKQYLLLGGQNHIPGLGIPTRNHQKLADYAKKWFDINEITYRWKAMDYIAYDYLPLIGKMYPWSKNMYVITGFKKWGLSASVVAARTLRDLILREKTAESELFYPHRMQAVLSIPKTGFDYLLNKFDK